MALNEKLAFQSNDKADEKNTNWKKIRKYLQIFSFFFDKGMPILPERISLLDVSFKHDSFNIFYCSYLLWHVCNRKLWKDEKYLKKFATVMNSSSMRSQQKKLVRNFLLDVNSFKTLHFLLLPRRNWRKPLGKFIYI